MRRHFIPLLAGVTVRARPKNVLSPFAATEVMINKTNSAYGLCLAQQNGFYSDASQNFWGFRKDTLSAMAAVSMGVQAKLST